MLIRDHINKCVVFQKDWDTSRLSRAHLVSSHHVTRAESFAQSVLVPPLQYKERPPARPVPLPETVERLANFCNP